MCSKVLNCDRCSYVATIVDVMGKLWTNVADVATIAVAMWFHVVETAI